ncbi:MAG: Ppx/GppA phosphatase [Myxococcales bacterium]|nr:Ppx/GppA phosphatase [Myxococcales bacterium]
MTKAVIDIGTNTLLLLIVDEQIQPLVDLCRFGRLGKGLDASGKLAPESIAKSLDICREYRRVMDEHGVTRLSIIGTQALREATNAAEFVGPAERVLGGSIEIIAGMREAELAATAVARTLPDLATSRYVVVDVGGGSTELISVDGGRVLSAVSVPIGAVRLTERHLRHDPPSSDELASLEADIDRHLAPLDLPTGAPIVGTAGTATTMAAAKLSLARYDPNAVTGLRMSPTDIATQYARLASATVAARRDMPGITAERADVIAAGVAIYVRVMHRVSAPVFVACDRGIRWGVAYEQAAPNKAADE